MLASPLRSSARTWNVRSSLCLPNTLNTKSYETSVAESIGRDRVCAPWFRPAYAAHYKKLWSHTETGSLVSDLNYWSSSSNRSSERICFPSYTSSLPDTTACESTAPPTPSEGSETEQPPPAKRQKVDKMKRLNDQNLLMRCRKIRVIPTKEQVLQLQKIYGIHRHIYNECVEAEQSGDLQGASVAVKSEWRRRLTKKSEYTAAGKAWKDDATCHVKQQAVEEYFRAKKAALSNFAAGNNAGFTMRKRSKFKSRCETVPFEGYKLSDCGDSAFIAVRGLDGELRVRGHLPKELVGREDTKLEREEIKLVRTRLGYYYAIISIQVQQKQGSADGVCAMDPGQRTFQTWYSDTGRCGKVGKFDPQQVLLQKADGLASRLKLKGPQKNAGWRRRIRRQFLRTLEKVRNRTEDLHHKVASWMAASVRLILIPVFESSEMIQGGNLSSRVCRSMQCWSHYKFRKHLEAHAQLYKHTRVQTVNEAYTTRQCGQCGAVNDSVGSSSTFWCEECGQREDRDYHAARNILLRSLPYIAPRA
jgi:transposase